MNDLFGNEILEMKPIERDKLEMIFKKYLLGIKEKELVSAMYSKFEAIIDYVKLCNGESVGEKISMLFNPHRYSTKTIKSKSIIEAFETENFISGLARATLFKEGKVLDLLYQVLQLGINGIQYVNEFPPIIARRYGIAFNAKKILDPCAGWGGRMIGAASIGSFYYGFEPATKTFQGLLELGEFLKSFENGFDYKIENIPFEDANLSDVYDLALTSPPYFDTEIYSNEITNSMNKFKDFESWKNGFYLPMIKKTLMNSKAFILNVGNRRYELAKILMEEYPGAIEIDSKLSGKSGMGKSREGAESFYLIKKGGK